MFSRPNSCESRPSSITRSVRGSFSNGLEVVPPDLSDNVLLSSLQLSSTVETSNQSSSSRSNSTAGGESIHDGEVIEEDFRKSKCFLKKKV